MQILKSGIHTVYISDSYFIENLELANLTPQTPTKGRVIEFLVDAAYYELGLGIDRKSQESFTDFCREIGPSQDFNVGILSAVGGNFLGKWCYNDGVFPKSVQKWINRYDGVHNLLLVDVDNPKNKGSSVKKSFLVTPKGSIYCKLHSKEPKYNLFFPEF